MTLNNLFTLAIISILFALALILGSIAYTMLRSGVPLCH
jgi:hypothetical protein